MTFRELRNQLSIILQGTLLLSAYDVFSRMQIERLLLEYQPTMLFVEHDVRFRERIASRTIEL